MRFARRISFALAVVLIVGLIGARLVQPAAAQDASIKLDFSGGLPVPAAAAAHISITATTAAFI